MGRSRDATPWPERARTLTHQQYGGEAQVRTAATPIEVRAWICSMRGDDREVDALAIAWTPRAVRIRYVDQHGRADTAWVWASAVTRR